MSNYSIYQVMGSSPGHVTLWDDASRRTHHNYLFGYFTLAIHAINPGVNPGVFIQVFMSHEHKKVQLPVLFAVVVCQLSIASLLSRDSARAPGMHMSCDLQRDLWDACAMLLKIYEGSEGTFCH